MNGITFPQIMQFSDGVVAAAASAGMVFSALVGLIAMGLAAAAAAVAAAAQKRKTPAPAPVRVRSGQPARRRR